jgi:excisionase family DNA binding protein
MTHTELPRSSPRISLTVAETAKATGLSETYLRLLIARHNLPCVRVGRAVRVLVRDLESFLAGNRHGGVENAR